MATRTGLENSGRPLSRGMSLSSRAVQLSVTQGAGVGADDTRDQAGEDIDDCR
jgi:hypothetical protein